MRIALLAIAAVSVSGCATERHGAVSVAPSFSTPSTSFQTSYVSRAPSTVERVHVNADLVVRPDRVCVPVMVQADASEDGVALSLVEAMNAKIAAAAGPGVTLRADDIDTKSMRTKAGVSSSVTWRGVVETELPDGDAWSRAKKVAALHRAVTALATPPDFWDEARDDKDPPVATVVVGAPEPGVRDIEQHRPKLLAGWGERAKALASVADGGALELMSCQPPAQVVVVGGTLEKVGLTLPVHCTFQVRRATP